MNKTEHKAIIEGLLFVMGEEGIEVDQIAQILEVDRAYIIEVLQEMIREFESHRRGMQIVEVAGTYQFTTRSEHAVYLERLARNPSRSSLSQAALETLAIVAYKQPVTRAEIEEVRGVKSEKAIHTLTNKSLIKEVGRKEGAGRAILYGTTKEFLEYFGLRHLDDLPDLSEEIDMEDVKKEADLFFSSSLDSSSSS